jgi:hypothetical protein
MGPFAIIGSILSEQFLGPCEAIGKMFQMQSWAHSITSVVFGQSNFWANVNPSAKCSKTRMGPFAIIGSILSEQFLGPCEPIGRMSQKQKWAHSMSSVVLCLRILWAHVKASAKCSSYNTGPVHFYQQYYV